jgi:hypothetical protein
MFVECVRKNKESHMKDIIKLVSGLALAALILAAAESSAIHGVVTKMDRATSTVAVKTADGTEHTVKVAENTTVRGTKDGMAGLKTGSDVVVHYTTKGSEKAAVELDVVGKEGMKATEGTITKIDRKTKTLTVKTADGAEETYKLSAHATNDAGKDMAAGSEKSAKVTVYYTEDAGKKVAHFFEKM